jgi:hypothetical protein
MLKAPVEELNVDELVHNIRNDYLAMDSYKPDARAA